jgi:hypothetical protein
MIPIPFKNTLTNMVSGGYNQGVLITGGAELVDESGTYTYSCCEEGTINLRPMFTVVYQSGVFVNAQPLSGSSSTTARIRNQALSYSRIGFSVNNVVKGYIDSTGHHDGSF